MKKLFVLLPLVLLSSNLRGQSRELKKQIGDFDTYVENARKEWNVPGLAIAVVKDNTVIFQKGYGVREVGTNNLVDTNTLFACASTTKAMTATCIGILVDEGKVKWDDPVSMYLPEFQLHESFVTQELRIRDLLIHNSGIGNTDFLWAAMDIPSEEILKRMRLVEPSYSLRSSFIYQNIFYLAAGKVIEQVSGEPWEVYIQNRIFKPLGMIRTVPMLNMVTDKNQTRPHQIKEGKVTLIEDMSADAIGPAGSVWSSISDISIWMACMLDSSKYNGGRLVSASTWIEMFKPQTIIPANEFYPTAELTKPNWTTYGLGWFQHDYKGKKVNFHTGSLAGAIAIHGQLPSERIGVYIYGNLDHAEIRHALMYKAFDLFALGGNVDWSKDLKDLYQKAEFKQESRRKEFESKKVLNTRPSHELADFAGKYHDPLFGNLEVATSGDKLLVTLNGIVKAELAHWHFDSFYGPFEKWWYGKAMAKFETDSMGKVAKIDFEGMVFSKE